VSHTVDPRIAILSALNDPPYNEVAEKRCVPWDDAVKLLHAYRAAVLREAADRYTKLTDQNEAYDLAEGGGISAEARIQYGTVRDVAAGLRRMADEQPKTEEG
jgi:hypothetical protein